MEYVTPALSQTPSPEGRISTQDESASALTAESRPALLDESTPALLDITPALLDGSKTVAADESTFSLSSQSAHVPQDELAAVTPVESSCAPSIESAPTSPEEFTPVPPDESAPASPDESAPVLTDESAPVPPDESAPAPPDESAPVPPDESAPVLPDESAPASPNESAPAPPDETAPAPPDESAPVLPDESAPVPPDESTPVPPDESTPVPPDESAPVPPDKSAPAPPDESAPVPPDESVLAPPDESVPVSPEESFPVSPEESFPVSPEESFPVSPEESFPVSPEESFPVSPEESFPVSPEESFPVSPEESFPVSPEESFPVSPEESFPVSPEESFPVSPEESVPVSPEESVPVSPEESVPVSPEESVPVSPEESVPVSPEESAPSPPAESAPVPPDESAPVPPDESAPAPAELALVSPYDIMASQRRDTTLVRPDQSADALSDVPDSMPPNHSVPAPDESTPASADWSPLIPDDSYIVPPVEVINESPDEITNVSPFKATPVSPDEVTNASPDEDTVASPVEVSNVSPDEVSHTSDEVTLASPDEVAIGSPVETIHVSPHDIRVSPDKVTNALPVKFTPTSPAEITDASPDEIVCTSSQEVTFSSADNLIPASPEEVTNASPVKVTSPPQVTVTPDSQIEDTSSAYKANPVSKGRTDTTQEDTTNDPNFQEHTVIPRQSIPVVQRKASPPLQDETLKAAPLHRTGAPSLQKKALCGAPPITVLQSTAPAAKNITGAIHLPVNVSVASPTQVSASPSTSLLASTPSVGVSAGLPNIHFQKEKGGLFQAGKTGVVGCSISPVAPQNVLAAPSISTSAKPATTTFSGPSSSTIPTPMGNKALSASLYVKDKMESTKPAFIDISDMVQLDPSSPTDIREARMVGYAARDKVTTLLGINANKPQDSKGPSRTNTGTNHAGHASNAVSKLVNNSLPPRNTDLLPASSVAEQYTVPSEAERQEEMLAMQRDCVQDPSSLPNSSLRACPEPVRSLSTSLTKPMLQMRRVSDASRNKSLPVVVKEEPKDVEVISDSAVIDTQHSVPYIKPERTDISAMKYDNAQTQSAVLNPVHSEHTTSRKEGTHGATPISDSNITQNINLLSRLQNKFSTLREQQLDCVLTTEDVLTYTAPSIPVKFRDKFPASDFNCSGCDDTFLFASSLENHLNRKSMQIVCKDKKCTEQGQEPVFTNRCAYFVHLKTHGTLDEDLQLTVLAASSEMLDSCTDIVTLSDSKPQLMEDGDFTSEWRCVECNLHFSTSEDLAIHFVPKADVGLEGMKCGFCNKFFLTKCSLSAHIRTHSREKPFVCPECGQKFLGGWDAFAKHLRLKCFHSYRACTFRCPRCITITASSSDMVQHVMSHKEMYFKCLKCPMAFKTCKTIQSHMRTTHNVNSSNSTFIFKCAICETVFHSLNQLENHTNSHVNEFNKVRNSSFRCSLCRRLIEDKQMFEQHLTTTHNIQPSRILCDICGEEYDTFSHLCKHLEKHKDTDDLTNAIEQTTTEAPSEIPRKSKKAKKKKTKVKSPTSGAKMFSCSVCEFRCAKANNVTEIYAHIQKHRQDGIFLCPICFTAKFHNVTDLNHHQFLCRKKKSVQKGSPKFKSGGIHLCSKCKENFRNEDDLGRHMEHEHGVGPHFPCHLCGLTYDTRQSLLQHIQVIHEGKKHVYICWICQSKNIKRTFTIAQKLTKHLISKHRVSRNTIDPEKFPRLLPGLNDKDIIVSGQLKRSAAEDANQAPIKRLKVVGDAVFNCAKCEFSSEDKDVFKAHIKKHKKETDSKQCPECGLCFSVLPSLKKHLIMVHKIEEVNKYVESSGINDTVKEEFSPMVSTTMVTEADSSQDVESGNPLECRVCYRSFDTVALLKTHMRTHGMAFIRSKRSVVSSASPSVS